MSHHYTSVRPNGVFYAGAYLCYMNEFCEDFSPLLWCMPVEDHELDPLRDPVTHHDRTLQGWVIPHRATHNIASIIQELNSNHHTKYIMISSFPL